MKIGILTFHAASNFGANLQAYSSVCIYRRLGHQVKVINYLRSGDFNYINTVNAKQFQEHSSFVEESLPITREVTTPEELLQVVKYEKFDLISIGADAVWRLPNDENKLIFFADWLLNEPDHPFVVAMSAAHMGQGFKSLPETLKKRIKDDLEKFSFISVRDEWTRKKINEDIIKRNFVKYINPDPVIWLSDFTSELKTPNDSKFLERPYYLMSLPVRCDGNSKMREWFTTFKYLVNKAGYNLVELPLPEGISGLDFDYTIKYPINPLHWFTYIGRARAFCGLRFHAIVSSISSGTPFFSIDSYGNQSLFPRVARYLGWYRVGRAFDDKSKIRNLLLGSGFEKYRVSGSIIQISPYKVFDMLEHFDKAKLLAFRKSLRYIYTSTMDLMFESLNNEN